MATILEKANEILAEKTSKLLPEHLKSGVTCLGVGGTLIDLQEGSADATASAVDIAEGKTAYVNGIKITGNLEEVTSIGGAGGGEITVNTDNVVISETNDATVIAKTGATISTMVTNEELAASIGLTADKLTTGNTVLGVEGNATSGLDTSDATATADDILLGKTAYVNGEKITGTISDYEKIDYSANNFELVGDMLTIKKTYATMGLSGAEDFVLTVKIPETLISTFKKHKDQCVIRARKNIEDAGWDIYLYTPVIENTVLHITCQTAIYNGVTLRQAFKVNENMNSPYILAATSDDKTYKDDATIKIAYAYAYDCTDTSCGSSSNNTTNYQSITTSSGLNQELICIGSDDMIDNITIGSFYTYYDWSIKPNTIDDVQMYYVDLVQPMVVGKDVVDQTSSFNVSTSTLVDDNNSADPFSSWSWTNPNGTVTVDEADVEGLEAPSFLRYHKNTTATNRWEWSLCSYYIANHLPDIAPWFDLVWTDGNTGYGSTNGTITGKLISGSTELTEITYLSNSDAVRTGYTTNVDMSTITNWTLHLDFKLIYEYYA